MQCFTQGQKIVNMQAYSMRSGNCVSEIDSVSTEKDFIQGYTMTLSFLIIIMRFARKASKELVLIIIIIIIYFL